MWFNRKPKPEEPAIGTYRVRWIRMVDHDNVRKLRCVAEIYDFFYWDWWRGWYPVTNIAYKTEQDALAAIANDRAPVPPAKIIP